VTTRPTPTDVRHALDVLASAATPVPAIPGNDAWFAIAVKDGADQDRPYWIAAHPAVAGGGPSIQMYEPPADDDDTGGTRPSRSARYPPGDGAEVETAAARLAALARVMRAEQPPLDLAPKRGDLVRWVGSVPESPERAKEMFRRRRDEDCLVVHATENGLVYSVEPGDPLSIWPSPVDQVMVVARATYTAVGDEVAG
jgi:hypothetical protein